MHDDTFENVRQFQFHQDLPGQATLRIVPAPEYSDRDQARIVANLGRKLDGLLHICVERVDSLPLTPRGKQTYVVQAIPGRNEDSAKRSEAAAMPSTTTPANGSANFPARTRLGPEDRQLAKLLPVITQKSGPAI
jgi:hypothetical protein